MSKDYFKEFEHICTELSAKTVEKYVLAEKEQVQATILGSEKAIMFDKVYLFEAVKNSLGIEKSMTHFDAHGYGSIVTFKMPIKYKDQFVKNVEKLFEGYKVGDESLHYPEDGGVGVYIKEHNNDVWAFVCDDMRSYDEYLYLLEGLPAEEVVYVFGDENSGANFAFETKMENFEIYEQLVEIGWIELDTNE